MSSQHTALAELIRELSCEALLPNHAAASWPSSSGSSDNSAAAVHRRRCALRQCQFAFTNAGGACLAPLTMREVDLDKLRVLAAPSSALRVGAGGLGGGGGAAATGIDPSLRTSSLSKSSGGTTAAANNNSRGGGTRGSNNRQSAGGGGVRCGADGDDGDDGWVNVRGHAEVGGNASSSFSSPPLSDAPTRISDWCRTLAQPFSVFVEAAPGMGKTTLARHICTTQSFFFLAVPSSSTTIATTANATAAAPTPTPALALYLPLRAILAGNVEIVTLRQLLDVVLDRALGLTPAFLARFAAPRALRRRAAELERLEAAARAAVAGDGERVRGQIEGAVVRGKRQGVVAAVLGAPCEPLPSPSPYPPHHEPGQDQSTTTTADEPTTTSELVDAIIASDLPIVWVLDDLDCIDRATPRGFIQSFLAEFVAPSGRQSEATLTISRLTGSPVRAADSVLCFTRDERNRGAVSICDGLPHSCNKVFVLERWRGHETRARLASPSSWTAREAFRHVVQSRVPHGAIAPTELNRIIDSVVDANELFFTDSIPALEAAVGGMSNSFAARAPPPAAADGGGRGRDDGSAAVQAPFAGTPYFIDLLAMSVFDTAVGLDFATAAPSSSSPSSPSATIHNGSITATSPSSYADEPVVTCARALSGAAAVAAMTIMPSAFTEERLLRFVSPIAAFEHFVALRLHRSMQVLRGSQSQQQSGDGAGGGGAGASARPQPVCYSSVTPAIKQLIDQAGRTALRMLTAAADDVSLASQPQSQQHRRSQVLSSSGPSGLVFSMADLMISGGVTGAGVGSSVASSLSSAAGGITKSIVNFFSSAASSSSSTSSARDGGVGTAAAAAALTAWAETLCDAGLMTRCDRHADASCTTTPTATPVAHHHHHPPSQRPHGADAAADASPSSSPPPPSPASHLATATATIFTTYSFRNRMDMELFAACFVSHEVSHRESLPWHPFLRVAWLVLASHVALSERRHAREARPQTIGFQQTLSTRFVDAYHARRVAIGRDRIRLLDATSLDANEDATCSNLVVEVAQAFDAVGGCDAVFEAVSCQHGLHVNLPSHTFWMFDACGRFGFVSALNALHARIGSNGDLSRRDVPSELWQRLVLLAATSGQCDDAALDRIVLLATEFHPWLQELQLNAPQRMRLSFA